MYVDGSKVSYAKQVAMSGSLLDDSAEDLLIGWGYGTRYFKDRGGTASVVLNSQGSCTTSADAVKIATPNLVSAGAMWKYLDNGSDQGTEWEELSFDDNSWSAGLLCSNFIRFLR